MKKLIAFNSAALMLCCMMTSCGNNGDSNADSMNGTESSASSSEAATEKETEKSTEVSTEKKTETSKKDNKSEKDSKMVDENGDGIIGGVEDAGEDIINGAAFKKSS